MSLDHVVLPSLAVLATWLSVGALLTGCGYLVRRAVLRLYPSRTAGGMRVADVWVGLAVLVAYLQLWSLGLRIGRGAWIAPVVVGIVGLVAGARRSGRFRAASLSLGVLALTALGTLWLANQALGAA